MALKVKLFDKETKGFGNIDLEDGKYVFEIVDVESNAAKSGRGRLQLRCKTVEGPVVGATAFDWWNLPEPTDDPNKYIKNFWRDATKAWPHIYDEQKEQLDETLLKGLRFKVTVSHEERKDADGKATGEMQMRTKSHRFLPKGVEAAAPAGAPAAESKPETFAQP